MINKKFIYFPAFSAGVIANEIRKDYHFKNGLPVNFCSSKFPSEFRYPYFLVSAGHYYKRKNFITEWNLNEPDITVLGDSGGFQIASGAIKWDKNLCGYILSWLEDNTNIAMNLDIPPRLKYENKFKECLDISKSNFKYFSEKRVGKTTLLNVLQGDDINTYTRWYSEVKDFDFDGWGIGGCGGSLYRFICGITALMSGAEQFKSQNKYIHILGTSKILDFLILAQFQKSLNEIGSHIQVTTDSSSPNISGSRFGLYYYDFDIKVGSFKSFHIPKDRAENNSNKSKTGNNSFCDNKENLLPEIIEFDKLLRAAYDFNDMKVWNNDINLAVVIHNLMYFNYTINVINQLVYGHYYFLEQTCSNDSLLILKCVDDIVKAKSNGDEPLLIFKKYEMFLKNYDKKSINIVTENNFF